MTQEEEKLLFRDLCARLAYGVKCVFHSKNGDIPAAITKVNAETRMVSYKPVGSTVAYYCYVDGVKPYLRPMSSMTEKELMELDKIFYDFFKSDDSTKGSSHCLLFDFYNKHHLDYRGLIPKGLALEATKGMYNENK